MLVSQLNGQEGKKKKQWENGPTMSDTSGPKFGSKGQPEMPDYPNSVLTSVVTVAM
jgi:hypothetical protein